MIITSANVYIPGNTMFILPFGNIPLKSIIKDNCIEFKVSSDMQWLVNLCGIRIQYIVEDEKKI